MAFRFPIRCRREKFLAQVWKRRGVSASLAIQGILLGGRLRMWRSFGTCLHRSRITTITAGLAREVCEGCGRVRLHYVEASVQIRPDLEPTVAELSEAMVFEARITFEDSRLRKCLHCGQQAVFMIPDGLVCDEHAWQAAARLDWDESDPWVPIRIDRSNA